MAQDFAKKNKNYPKVTAANKKAKDTETKGSSKKLLIFFFTISIIITCCFVIYIQNGMIFKLEIAKNDNDKGLNTNPKFEFYKILPDMQVKLIEEKQKLKDKVQEKVSKNNDIISSQNKISLNNEVKIQDLNPPSKITDLNNNKNIKVDSKIEKIETGIRQKEKTHTASNKNDYFLQLASFKDYKDADNLRAKLILSGIDVDIFKAKLSNGDVWYRVRSKKSRNYQEVDGLKNKLLAFRVNAIILKDIG